MSTKPEHERRQRDRHRFFVSELIDGLRGRHKNARVYNVLKKTVEEDLPAPRLGESSSFRILGAHKGSLWATGDDAALVVSPEWLEGDKFFQLMLLESKYIQVRNRLCGEGLACGEEHFYLSATLREPRKIATPGCPMCALLAIPTRVYVVINGEFQRNGKRGIKKEHVTVAEALFEAAHVGAHTVGVN